MQLPYLSSICIWAVLQEKLVICIGINMNEIDKVNKYGSIQAVNKIAPVRKIKGSKDFHDQFNSMELAKRAIQSSKMDLFNKENEQKIGGVDFSKVLLTYDSIVKDKDKINREGDKVVKHIEDEWKTHKSEYSYLAENGLIEYKGIIFEYNEDKDIISLGDMSNMENVLSINLSGGTVLYVNRNRIDSLIKAIGMFKPEDVKKIVDAIAIDERARNKPLEVEKEQNDTFNEMMDKIEGKGETDKKVKVEEK